MRVLAVCVGTPGHLNPLLPLLGAFAAHGDEVVVATSADVGDAVAAAGLRLHRVGSGFAGWYATLRARTRGTPGEGLPPDRIGHYFFPRLFAEIAAADMLDGTVDAARAFAPDLVIFESFAYAAPLAAAICGVPAVCVQVGLPPGNDVLDLVADALSPLWSVSGQRVDRHRALVGDLLVDTVPLSLARGVPATDATRMRPTSVPATTPAPEDPPLVHVTFGTVAHHDLDALRCVVEALGDEPIRVVATIGNGDRPAWVDALPANATVERYVPHAQLLPRCSALVHHGGAGTMFAALAHGLPQVIVPTAADQFDNAATMREADLAVTLDADALTSQSVRAAVRAALGSSTIRAGAREVATEIRAMPDAASVAATLRARFDQPAKRPRAAV